MRMGGTSLKTPNQACRILMSGEKGRQNSQCWELGEEEEVVMYHRRERMTFHPPSQDGHCLSKALQPYLSQALQPLNRLGRQAPEAGACPGHRVGQWHSLVTQVLGKSFSQHQAVSPGLRENASGFKVGSLQPEGKRQQAGWQRKVKLAVTLGVI